MCTVTYVPTGNNQFILTSNRDEQPARSPKNISNLHLNHQEVRFPKDVKAGGTWISISNKNRVLCLLNGAFSKHIRKPSYRRSRGLMVLDFFEFDSALSFFKNYQFQGMEPFTLVAYDDGLLFEARWDEVDLFWKPIDAQQKHIWSSATLYDQETQEKRVQWFNAWADRYQEPTLVHILDFHQHAGEGDPYNDVMMNRGEIVKTVSITSIEKTEHAIQLIYRDLISDHQEKTKIELTRELEGIPKI